MISLLPLYLLGNLHCAGMCGPLVFFLAKHQHRWFYFLGRTLSFSMAGLVAAELGFLVCKNILPALFSLLIGGLILVFGFCSLFRLAYPGQKWLAKRTGELSVSLSKLIAKDSPWPVFMFGFCTILLPCGQTVVVFAAIAAHCHPIAGMLQGCLFALLTSPSLIAAMHASRVVQKWKKGAHISMGMAMLLVALLSICRGLADLNVIEHFTLSKKYHISLY